MEMRSKYSPSFQETHFADIHKVLPEEEEEGEEKITSNAEKPDNRLHRLVKIREGKRPHWGFSRQVSLETGFSVLTGESKTKDQGKLLSRSGNSFGDYGAARRVVEGRKGDFSIFKTKSALSRQNSALPRRESGIDHIQKNDVSAGGLQLDDDKSVNKSVPAGRYFAALRGPELDQVKVSLH